MDHKNDGIGNGEKDGPLIQWNRLRDKLLREAIMASREKTGGIDEQFIIDYLLDKLLKSKQRRTILELLQRKN